MFFLSEDNILICVCSQKGCQNGRIHHKECHKPNNLHIYYPKAYASSTRILCDKALVAAHQE